MFIRKTTTQKYLPNGKAYTTYRLVQQYRNVSGISKQETLLNLGSEFAISEGDWRQLCDRIEQLQGSAVLFELELSIELEQEAQRIAKILSTRNSEKSVARIVPVAPEFTDKDYQTVDVNSAIDSEVRCIGNEHLVYETVRKLGLPEILEAAGFNKKQLYIALASIIGRLIVPGSELSTHRYLTQDSALDEIMGTEFSNLDLKQLYFASDRLLANKTAIESSLYLREKELFALDEVITLFDITNTYFEGHPQHSGANKGRSKEKRSDCALISLGLLLDSSGFPKKSKILPGNISDPSTLKGMLADLDSSSGTTIIMDAGIATKENLEYLKAEGYKYIVVRRDGNLVMPENDTTIVKDTKNNTVTVSLVTSTANEVELYCHSTAKEAKAKEFTTKMTKRFEEELAKLTQNLVACDLYDDFSEYNGQSCAIILADGQVLTNKPLELITCVVMVNTVTDVAANIMHQFILDSELTGLLQADADALKLCGQYLKQIRWHSKLQGRLRTLFGNRIQITKKNVTREYAKVAIRIGKLKQQYKSVSYTYDIAIIPDSKKHYARTITYQNDEALQKNKQAGIYCLSSNRSELTAEQLWNTYTMLTEIESAFRSLKSELGMRPVYHQLEHRIDGHIFISIIAYHILHTIRYQLKLHGINNSWDGLRKIMAIQLRTSTTMDLKIGGTVSLRKTSRATPEQAEIYRKLGINANPCGLVKTYLNLPG
jgi:transposase